MARAALCGYTYVGAALSASFAWIEIDAVRWAVRVCGKGAGVAGEVGTTNARPPECGSDDEAARFTWWLGCFSAMCAFLCPLPLPSIHPFLLSL